ncbi:hypothetical protein GE21DRAFT_1223544, partial [Neurospora crassa]
LIFINRFSIYRNTYRSIIKAYQSPARLPYNTRIRNINIFPIVLGPYTLNFNNIIKALRYLILLNKGTIIISIKGRPTLILVFTLYYTSDILQ